MEKDLLGSTNALGAFAAVARERGDNAAAAVAQSRCEAIVGNDRVCRGDYPRAPFFHGTKAAYAAPFGVLMLSLLYRVVRQRRAAKQGRDATGRFLVAPWIGHAAWLQGLAVFGAAIYVIARANSPILTTTTLAFALALTLMAERRGFFASVRRGKIPGFALRPSLPEDQHLPLVALFFRPTAEQTLEREDAGNYRDAPRKPALRVGRRLTPIALSFAFAVVVTVVIVVFLLAGATRGFSSF